MARARADGATLYYEVHGSGPPMVFSHGGQGSHLEWWQQVGEFARDHRVIVWDQRGYGFSDGTPNEVGDDSPTEDLTFVLDAAGVDEPVVCVGHSLGGWSVSGLARRDPDRVRALVMVGTPFNLANPTLSRWAAWMLRRIDEGMDVMELSFAPGFRDRRPDLAALHGMLRQLNPPRQGPRGLVAYERMRDQPDLDLSGWTVPTLFLVGDQDELTVPWVIEGTAAAVPGGRVVTIPDAGHGAYWERADLVNAEIRSLLAGV